MTEGTSQRDQAGGMVREFKSGEILAKLFSHLVTSPSSPWRRLEIAGSLQDWLEARGDFFPDPRIHHIIEAERQRALGEFAASMRRPPAPSSARLSTEAGGSFLPHGLAPDQPSLLLPTPNPVLSPVPEGFMDEPPPHPDPVPSSVPEGSKAEPPSHSVPVREGLVDGLPPLPAPVPGPVMEGSEDELPPSLVPVLEEFVEDLSPFPVPVPEEASATDLHSLAEGPSGLCIDRLGSSGFCTVPLSSTVHSPGPAAGCQISSLYTARLGSSGLRIMPLSSTVGSPGPAAGRQIIGRYVAGLLSSYVTGPLITCPYVAGLLIAGSAGDSLLIVGSARDSHRASCLNSRSAGDGLWAGRLNSGSAGDGLRAVRLNSCPPSEAPSAHPGRMFVLFLFCGRLGSALKRRGYVIPACVLVKLPWVVLCGVGVLFHGGLRLTVCGENCFVSLLVFLLFRETPQWLES
ncbi:hypothetical protein CRENBAI_024726 [Crenichthys baileyi]|uniref:Uncharacterized protein n=1 Tax=Crenichthys baileyi TaxID=28760 RepID=A0AAV9QZS2_9TELE